MAMVLAVQQRFPKMHRFLDPQTPSNGAFTPSEKHTKHQYFLEPEASNKTKLISLVFSTTILPTGDIMSSLFKKLKGKSRESEQKQVKVDRFVKTPRLRHQAHYWQLDKQGKRYDLKVRLACTNQGSHHHSFCETATKAFGQREAHIYDDVVQKYCQSWGKAIAERAVMPLNRRLDVEIRFNVCKKLFVTGGILTGFEVNEGSRDLSRLMEDLNGIDDVNATLVDLDLDTAADRQQGAVQGVNTNYMPWAVSHVEVLEVVSCHGIETWATFCSPPLFLQSFALSGWFFVFPYFFSHSRSGRDTARGIKLYWEYEGNGCLAEIEVPT